MQTAGEGMGVPSGNGGAGGNSGRQTQRGQTGTECTSDTHGEKRKSERGKGGGLHQHRAERDGGEVTSVCECKEERDVFDLE